VAENRGAVALVKRLAGFPAGDCCGESLTAPTVERETLRRLVVGSGQRVSLGRAISDDWPRIGNLLERSKLSPDGLKPWLMNTIVGLVGDEVVAVAAFEMYGDAGLLRSVAVIPDLRGRGLGAELVRMVEVLAAERGIGRFYLLTETADDFFSKLGYAKTTREALPAGMAKSELLRHVCPVSARVMVRDLK